MIFWQRRRERRGIIPLIAGILSTVGSLYTDNRNRQQARDQMAFQERMSSTAAQRSREDYEKAGLNPALAYERTASSPGGAAAQMGDPVQAGISNAMAAKRFIQEMKLQKMQAEESVALMRGQQEQARSQAHLNMSAATRNQVEMGWNAVAQPFNLRTAAAQALMSEYLSTQEGLKIPGMTNTANWERTLQRAGPAIGTARTLSEIIKSLGGVIRR